MTRGNWITIGIFAVGLIGSALGLAVQFGRFSSAVEANTKAIEDLGHTWSTRLQADEAELRELRDRVITLEAE